MTRPPRTTALARAAVPSGASQRSPEDSPPRLPATKPSARGHRNAVMGEGPNSNGPPVGRNGDWGNSSENRDTNDMARDNTAYGMATFAPCSARAQATPPVERATDRPP